jgi:hypothetical protein
MYMMTSTFRAYVELFVIFGVSGRTVLSASPDEDIYEVLTVVANHRPNDSDEPVVSAAGYHR